MLITPKIGIRLVSVAILCLFSGIVVNSILCDYAHAVDAKGEIHEHPYGHDHHHGSTSPLTEHDHQDNGQDHDHDSGKDCCVDFTFTFFESLKRDYTLTFNLNSIVISVLFSLPNCISQMTGKNLFNGVWDYIEPPPAMLDIRVFIQSFQV